MSWLMTTVAIIMVAKYPLEGSLERGFEQGELEELCQQQEEEENQKKKHERK